MVKHLSICNHRHYLEMAIPTGTRTITHRASKASVALATALVLQNVFICNVLAQDRFRPRDNTVVLKSAISNQTLGNASFKDIDAAWRAQPQNIQAATAYARTVFILGLNEGDLRWYGSAKAALLPWWQDPKIPADTLFMRGLVKQGFHEFEAGLKDIDLAIAQNPQSAEFWSWRFALNLLQSDLKAADQDCQQIERYFGRPEALLHRAVLLYRSGQSELAIRTFNEILQNAAFAKQTDLEWVNFQLGEAYRVAGQNALALSVWKKQLNLTPQSHLIRLSLAELLNQQGMFAEAHKVSNIDTPSDALLVQALLASRGLKDRNEVKLDKLIAARLATQALRNESLIERPKLIYLIDYGKDPVAGLKLSIDNWQLQQEPRDAVLFVKAALLTQQASSAQPVLAWAEKTKYNDPQLAALLLQLKHKLKGQGVTP